MSIREKLIRERLAASLRVTDLTIKDQSHLHAGHAGAKDGRGHFAITIISPDFDGLKQIHRHQMVYDALGDLLESDIHAVQIRALTQSEK